MASAFSYNDINKKDNIIMQEYILTVEKEAVYDEIAKTTSYVGAKKNDPVAYDNLFTTDEDKDILERFWQESKKTICNTLKRVIISSEETEEGVFNVTIKLSSAFPEELLDSMNSSMFCFFVMNISAKWFVITSKEDAEAYATYASGHLEDLLRMALYKEAPKRPTYN